MKIQFFSKRILVGKYGNKEETGGNIYITLNLEAKNQKAETINHETITGYTILSMAGEIKDISNRKSIECGQILDTIKNPSNIREFAIDPEDFRIIIDTWEKYHLNDQQRICIHQNSFNYNLLLLPEKEIQKAVDDAKISENEKTIISRVIDKVDTFKVLKMIETAKCPKKYVYGSKWLLKPIPEDTLKTIKNIFNKYTSADPNDYQTTTSEQDNQISCNRCLT